MTKFVWVFGPTAVGKDTLISNVASDQNHDLVKKLNLEIPILIQQNALLERHDERNSLESRIYSDRNKAKTILLKWQGYDIGQRTIFKLCDLLPNDEFIYLFLDAPPEIIKQRREKRGQQPPDWNDTNDRSTCIHFAKDLESEGIKFIWLDNSGENPVELQRYSPHTLKY
jgi:hypothetical protein